MKARKTPEQRADEIARKTFDDVWRGPGGRSVDGLLELSKKKHISHLHGFRAPSEVSTDDFARMIEGILQNILDRVYGTETLQAHVAIDYTEPFYAGHFGIFPGQAMTSWYVTKREV